MKICFFNCVKTWGGGEKWHLDMALALSQEQHEVVIASDQNSELLRRAAANGIRTKTFSIKNLSFLNPLKILSLYTFFRSERFDVLVINLSKDLKIAAPSAKWAKIPQRIYRRGSAIPIKNNFLNRFLFSQCLTGVLANSEATKKTILQNNPHLFPADKIKVIYNGIRIYGTDNAYVNDVPVIGNLGRLVYQKRQDLLIDVAEILRGRGVLCKFLIGGDGPLMNDLRQKTAEKNLENDVEFVGFVESSDEFMRKIDIFALPSRWEGFGYVLAEAMVARKPLVGFDISSNPELIFDGENGFLVSDGDKEQFADRLETLIRNPQKRQEMGQRGLEIVQKKFDIEKNKQQVADYLLQPINTKK